VTTDRRILVVEDNAPYLEDLKVILVKDLEELEPVGESMVEKAIERLDDVELIDKIKLVIVDLELHGGDASGPADFEGRDLILPKLRSNACWIPAVVMSRYFTGDAHVLAEATPYGFDAVVPKKFFSESRTYKKQWQRVKEVAAASRVGVLTGRDTHKILHLLTQDIDLQIGAEVAKEIDKYGGEDFRSALRLMEFTSSRIVIDQVVQGFSGLSVVKLTCRRGGRRVKWLLKFGSSFQKLDRELAAHRRMFLDGITRRMSVPVLWWRPIIWGSVGMIAYEFEENATTLLEEIKSNGLMGGLRKIGPALEELYRGCEVEAVIPRNCLEGTISRADTSGLRAKQGAILRALVAREPHPHLDRSLEVRLGPQHGDLHTRNILIGERGPVLIDFAHYRGIGEGGVPLLDLAKLFVDIWACGGGIPLNDILDGGVLRRQGEYGRWGDILIDSEPSGDEMRLFRLAVACQLAKYSKYTDVAKEKRREAQRALNNF